MPQGHVALTGTSEPADLAGLHTEPGRLLARVIARSEATKPHKRQGAPFGLDRIALARLAMRGAEALAGCVVIACLVMGGAWWRLTFMGAAQTIAIACLTLKLRRGKRRQAFGRFRVAFQTASLHKFDFRRVLHSLQLENSCDI
jgi:hypothetical protein